VEPLQQSIEDNRISNNHLFAYLVAFYCSVLDMFPHAFLPTADLPPQQGQNRTVNLNKCQQGYLTNSYPPWIASKALGTDCLKGPNHFKNTPNSKLDTWSVFVKSTTDQ
jgi:hypothetical protein